MFTRRPLLRIPHLKLFVSVSLLVLYFRFHVLELAFQLVNGGRCPSYSSQHDRGSRFPGRCCPRMDRCFLFFCLLRVLEVFGLYATLIFSLIIIIIITVVCHVSDVTVDFQATLKDVLVCDVVLMALTSSVIIIIIIILFV